MQTTPPPGAGPGAPQNPTEPTTRERVARYKTLARRSLAYWKLGILLFVIGCGIAVAVAMNVKRTYRSECVVLVKSGIVLSGDDRDSPEATGAKQAAKLKEALTLRSKLEGAIKKFKLYPNTVESKGMLDAVDEMKPHVGFRARDGGTYVVSFDATESNGVNTQDLVRDVTQYLAEQLIEEYASGNLGDLKMRSDFLAKEQGKAEADLEKATQALTVFLSQHPEFAMEAKQAAASNPFGMAPNPAMGIPLMPKQTPDKTKPHQPTMDPALAALYGSDPQLGALYRQRARLEAEARSAGGGTAPTPVPASTAGIAALKEQVATAQGEVEAAAKRAAETQADVMGKQSSLSPEHPDMKAAQANADLAARQLHQAKVKLATLQQQLHAAENPTAPKSDNPYDAPGGNPEIAAKMKEINSQIAQREAELKAKGPAAIASAAPAPSTSAAPSGSAAVPAVPVIPVSPLVALETEWQRLLRGLSEAKATHDGLKKEYEKAQMGVKAAQAAAADLMQVIEPAYRPTHPAKGGRTPVAIGGAAAALIVALLYMIARVAFNDTIIDSADVEALNLIPVLGVVPKIHMSSAPSASNDQAAAAAKGGRVGAV